jgi:hypothetical protein
VISIHKKIMAKDRPTIIYPEKKLTTTGTPYKHAFHRLMTNEAETYSTSTTLALAAGIHSCVAGALSRE